MRAKPDRSSSYVTTADTWGVILGLSLVNRNTSTLPGINVDQKSATGNCSNRQHCKNMTVLS